MPLALRNFRLTTCNSAFMQAELIADFGSAGRLRWIVSGIGATAVPEPGTLALLGLGLRRRRKPN